MTSTMSPGDRAKLVAARRAVEYVEDGMRVGLGTGSTAVFMVRALGQMVREEGLRITATATSTATADLAREVGIDLQPLEKLGRLDLTIDGADEIDGKMNLIKGGGGALLMEKIVATASDMMVVIADQSKAVDQLGRFPLPVEVVPFGWTSSQALIEDVLSGLGIEGVDIVLRPGTGGPFMTDQGNYILDLHLKRIAAPRQLALVLNQIPGVVENGLFLDMCDVAILGRPDGTVELRDLATGKVSYEQMEPAEADNLFSDIADG
ncbi:ribose-5-phosphate isomerase RpiA [Rhodobacterales bacterium HKCCE3408]|nr:ribose-5-phosphate isomerase RpiA [Rhodobacterales bacterium HKCCE3408]